MASSEAGWEVTRPLLPTSQALQSPPWASVWPAACLGTLAVGPRAVLSSWAALEGRESRGSQGMLGCGLLRATCFSKAFAGALGQ